MMSDNIHTLHLNNSPFCAIASGIKKIEFRLYDEKREKIKIGDTIIFENTDDAHQQVTVRVIALHRAKNFDDLFAHLPLNQIIVAHSSTPSHKTEAEKKEIALCKMQGFYPLSRQNQCGVVGIEFELLPSSMPSSCSGRLTS